MRWTVELNPRAVVMLLAMHEPVDKHQNKGDADHHGRVIYDHESVSHTILSPKDLEQGMQDQGKGLTHSTWCHWPERRDAEDNGEDEAKHND